MKLLVNSSRIFYKPFSKILSQPFQIELWLQKVNAYEIIIWLKYNKRGEGWY